MVEDLFSFETGRIEINFGLAEDFALGGSGIVAINRRGIGKAGEGVEGFFLFALAAEAGGGADAGQVDVADEGSVKVVDADFGAGVF